MVSVLYVNRPALLINESAKLLARHQTVIQVTVPDYQLVTKLKAWCDLGVMLIIPDVILPIPNPFAWLFLVYNTIKKS